MTTLEELGLLKMDFLGLRTLTVIEDALKLVKESKGIDLEFDKEMKDPKVYKLWAEGKSMRNIPVRKCWNDKVYERIKT